MAFFMFGYLIDQVTLFLNLRIHRGPQLFKILSGNSHISPFNLHTFQLLTADPMNLQTNEAFGV